MQMFTQRSLNLASAVVFSMLLVACGGSSGGTADTISGETDTSDSDGLSETTDNQNTDVPEGSSANWHGEIIIEQYTYGGPYGAAVLGNFYRYTGDVAQLASNVTSIPTEVECTTYGLASDGSVPEIQSRGTFEQVNAGEVIVLSGNSGTIAQMPLLDSEHHQYLIDTPIPEINAITSIQVSGDEFPALIITEIPTLEPLNVSKFPSGNQVGTSNLIEWVTSVGADDFLDIRGFATLETGESIGYVCLTPDVGLFELPPDIAARFGDSFVADYSTISRGKISHTLVGDISYSVYSFEVAYP